MKKILILSLLASLSLTAYANTATTNTGTPMTGAQVKKLITNNLFPFAQAADHNDVSVDFKGQYTLYLAFFKGGKLAGLASPAMVGGRSGDVGRWWMEGNLQCGQWDHWLNNKKFCVTWQQTDKDYIVRFTTGKLSGIIAKNLVE